MIKLALNNLADIVNVTIEIEEPVVNTTSFNNLLILGREPDKGIDTKNYDYCDVYTSLEGVAEAGAITTGDDASEIGKAARIAFSQNPAPSKLYVAFQKKEVCLSDCSVVLDEENNLCITYKKEKSPRDGVELGDVVSIMLKANEDEGKAIATAPTINEDGTETVAVPIEEAGEYTVTVTYGNKEDSTLNNSVVKACFTEWTCKVKVVFDGNGNLDIDNKISDYEYSYEPIGTTLANALEVNGWYVVCPTPELKDEFNTIAEWVSAHPKMMAFPVWDVPTEDEITANQALWTSMRAFAVYSNIKGSDNDYAYVALTAKCLNYTPGSETWALKTLVGITAAQLSSGKMKNLSSSNITYYTTYADRDVTQGGKTTYGEWIDVIRFRDWLQNDMQIRIFDLLAKNVKIPYTDEGIALVQNQMIASLKQGQINGGIANTEFDDDENEIPGYVVTVPLAANISDGQKKSRILTDCKFRARLAGAIHVVDVYGTLAYSI